MKRGELHWNYKDGAFVYETFRGELKARRRYCQRCRKDLYTANRWEWVIHHIDHNHYNNEIDNLELLCKSCHQIEHEVYKNFKVENE